MLICLLANQYTLFDIINGIKTIIYKVVYYLNNKNISSAIIKAKEK